MKKLALAAAVLGFVACSKADQNPTKAPKEPAGTASTAPAAPAAATEPKVVKATMPAASDPGNLPPAGTAPEPVTVDKQLDSLWSAQIKTLKGEPTTLAAYKGKALMLVNVASKCA